MPISPELEQKIIGDIYDASIEPSLWPQVLECVSGLFNVKFANMIFGDRLNPSSHIALSHGSTEKQMQLFFSSDYPERDMNYAIEWFRRGIPLGTAATNTHVFGNMDNFKEFAGPLYTGFYSKVDVYHQLVCMLDLTEYRYAVFGLHRGMADAPYTTQEVLSANHYMPHLRRAIQIHRQMSHVREQNKRLYAMMDNMVAGVMLLNNAGRICYANPAAEGLLSQSSALSSSARYGIKTAREDQWDELNILIHSAISAGLRKKQVMYDNATQIGGVMGVNNKRGDKLLMLTITPLSELSGYEQLASDGIAAGVFLTDPDAKKLLARKILQQNFLLQERECDICESFLNTATLEGVCDELGLSMNTVRGYMKGIYEKTDRRSQAELMKLLTGLTVEFEHIR